MKATKTTTNHAATKAPVEQAAAEAPATKTMAASVVEPKAKTTVAAKAAAKAPTTKVAPTPAAKPPATNVATADKTPVAKAAPTPAEKTSTTLAPTPPASSQSSGGKSLPQTAGAALAARIADARVTEVRLAKAISVAPRRIREIIEGKRRLTADTAVRLAVFFGDDAMTWMDYQLAYEIAQETQELSDVLASIVPLARVEQTPVVAFKGA